MGNEIYLTRNGLNAQNYKKETDRYYHFILLAKDEIGHKQIREISSRAWMRSYMARGMRRVPTYYQDLIDVIGANPGHVIAGNACLGGALPTQLIRNRDTGAPSMDLIKRWIRQIQGIFGADDFYFEMQPSFNKDQIYVNHKLVELGAELGIKYIITNDAHYLKKEDRPIHKAFLNSQNGDREVDSFYATTYLMSDEEVREYMEKEMGEEVLQSAYQTIEEIKYKCEDYSLKKPLKIPRLNWKNYNHLASGIWFARIPMLEKFVNSPYESDKHLAHAIVDKIYDSPDLQNQEACDEINACLEDTWISSEVNGSRWSAYFLNLQNIIDCCWDAGSLVGAARGSGMGFILLYILGITQINPLKEKAPTARWRFLNPNRVSVLDVDLDTEGSRRSAVLKQFRKIYGEDRVANVLTLKTEKSKSAIQTAARGIGLDADTAQYISSMIKSDRGQLRTLKETYYGDEEKGFKPNLQFVEQMDENPELWEVAQGIEGLINGVGVHAGGVVFKDEPFPESSALMRAPSGEIITQYELHDLEKCGDIKYDILSIDALDKIHNTLDLLCDYGYAERKETLKETYESIIGIYTLERDDLEMWKMCWDHKVNSLFQMMAQSGVSGIAAMKPTSVEDLALLNSAIRIMAQEKGGELPVQKLSRFKANPRNWDLELKEAGLGEKEKKILEPIVGFSYGLCIAQEQFMMLVQVPELGGFDLTWADRLRKSIAKKNPKDFRVLEGEYYNQVKEKNLDYNFCNYVWEKLVKPNAGYSFNLSHTLSYSLIGLQELNLAYKYPVIFWNCACLISDSGGGDEREENFNDEGADRNDNGQTFDDVSMGIFEDDANVESEETDSYDNAKARKASKINYGKIATAIGKFKSEGIEIAPPDINDSGITFVPNVERNQIIHGLSGITRIGNDFVKQIIENRPYSSIDDFNNKVKASKPQMINLIKAGCFDKLAGDRTKAMSCYIDKVADKKKRITLQNLKMLFDFNFVPNEFEEVRKVFNYNRYLKKFKNEDYFELDNIAFNFYNKNFDLDDLEESQGAESGFKIKKVVWKKYYDRYMDKIRPWVKKNSKELLQKVNSQIVNELWDKYCVGTISKWEMDSLSCYIHEHELSKLRYENYGFANYFNLPDNPVVVREFRSRQNGKLIPLYQINRIAGTVLDRDKNKKTVTLLTKEGVVNVKIYGDVFSHYDRQISQRGADGKKHVIEKSWFTRGNKIIVSGIKQEGMFIGKKYKSNDWHLVELITKIEDNGEIRVKREREAAE